MIQLSKRLEAAIQHTQGFQKLMDVGCDHAYLPIEACLRGYIKEAIASDNKSAPFENAVENIKLHQAEKLVKAVLSEGLETLDPSVDIVSILGMGGSLIVEILEKADLSSVKRLILSPNSDAHIVREALENHNFKIDDEEFVKDNDKFYQIMVVSHGSMQLNKNEKRFGPENIRKQTPEFVEYIQKMILQLDRARQKARQMFALKNLEHEIKQLKECIK